MLKLSQVKEQEGRDIARDKKSISNTNPPRYKYITCSKSKLFIYYLRHPLEEPPLPLSICRRCISKNQKEHPPLYLRITIYKIYYYLYNCIYQHKQSFASIAIKPLVSPAYLICAKLLAEDSKDKSFALRQSEQILLLVAYQTKPRK